MVHSYCWVHNLLWYTYLLLFHIVLSGSLSLYVLSPVMVHSWSVIVPRILVHSVFSDEFHLFRFTYRVWLFDALDSLRWHDYSSHSVHSTPLIYLSVRFTFFLCNNFEKRFAHNHYFYYAHPWLTQTSWLNHCRTGSLVEFVYSLGLVHIVNWFIHFSRFT